MEIYLWTFHYFLVSKLRRFIILQIIHEIMDENLEKKLENNDGFLKRAFKEEWPTMGNHLAACGVAIGAATGFSHYAPQFLDSDAAISGIATALDVGGYWGVLLPQLLYRDRNKLKDDDGKIDRKKVKKKLGEYLGLVGMIEGIYTVGRFLGQYYLQKKGWDPATASATIQLSATALFTLLLPPLRYAFRQWSEK